MAKMNVKSTDEWVSTTADLSEDSINYANKIRVNTDRNAVTLDFFFVSPESNDPQIEPHSRHIQRIILPVSLARETAAVLGDSIDSRDNRTEAWLEFDELFERLDNSGEIINDLDDERLSALRSRWSKRIRSLYEPDSGE